MIGIKSIASYVPVAGVDNYAQGARFGKDEDFILGKIGSTFLPRKDAGQETSDLCVEAANTLFANNPQLQRESIDVLIVVTQNGDEEGLPHTAAIVQDKLGLSTNVAAFDISLGCSGYVYGIYALKGFMEAAGLKNGLLITADPYSKIVDPEDRNTTMLFGDAATATWMGEGADWQLGKAKFGTDGSGAPHLKVSNGIFFMNGRQVFNFALLKVPAHLHELLAESDLTPDDIDAFCIHQGSAAIVDAVARRFEDKPEKFLKDMVETGNTVSSSIPLLIEKHVLGSSWKRVALSGFGVGLSWGSAIIYKG
ncbi:MULTISPECIES: ketoacyl-ACP synthase III [Pseudomonas syringae group]|nr:MULTISPECIES: ketoacyl-ACP synthase III [Pseudomonas syringae group]KPB68695.1 Beta-ketoacyl-acyl-carrier-protein synthase I [Pseudomonas syringae pv. maculicola]MBM0140836.1 ketoacyl-ACP synthase III [Pseudomonas cannabina pv. alisalensis]QQN24750.1 ketoacyl-ACP synthase III [Pseudomonas cannabina pv. alisalensis]RMN22843.1 Beta-ketoacyl-acyl-carrier-protein synthase I [Pseudomonas cannabina]UBZ00212.1 ketoacyl-ACP synthase III [Pseudomonas cannabina pv. alisalensis]